MSKLEEIHGIGQKEVNTLSKESITTVEDIAKSSPRALSKLFDVRINDTVDTIKHAREITEETFGFETAINVTPTSDFTRLNIPENVCGWEKFIQTQARVGWETPGSYRIIIDGHKNRIWGNLPNEDTESPSIITEEQVLRNRTESAEQAVDWAESWMETHAIDPSTNLSDLYGIGEKIAEHLQIVYAVNDATDLYQFIAKNEEIVEKIVGPQHFDQLSDKVKSEYSPGSPPSDEETINTQH